MMKPLDLWIDMRPYLGHMLLGVTAGCIVAIVTAVFTVSAAAMVDGPTFWLLTAWVLALFIVAAITGAAGSALYMNAYARKEWHAYHAVRHARGR